MYEETIIEGPQVSEIRELVAELGPKFKVWMVTQGRRSRKWLQEEMGVSASMVRRILNEGGRDVEPDMLRLFVRIVGENGQLPGVLISGKYENLSTKDPSFRDAAFSDAHLRTQRELRFCEWRKPGSILGRKYDTFSESCDRVLFMIRTNSPRACRAWVRSIGTLVVMTDKYGRVDKEKKPLAALVYPERLENMLERIAELTTEVSAMPADLLTAMDVSSDTPYFVRGARNYGPMVRAYCGLALGWPADAIDREVLQVFESLPQSVAHDDQFHENAMELLDALLGRDHPGAREWTHRFADFWQKSVGVFRVRTLVESLIVPHVAAAFASDAPGLVPDKFVAEGR